MPEAARPLQSPSPRRQARIEVLLIFLLFFIAGADPAPHRNEAHYLCRLKHYWDPTWCVGDLFLDSPEAHFTVVWLVGWLTWFLPMVAIAWIGRILSWGLLAWAWQRLSRRVVRRDWLAPLTAALWIVGTEQTHFAGEWVIGGFESKTLAYGFVLMALRDAAVRRWNRAWILLGVTSALHALVGAWSVVALLVAWVTAGRARPTPMAMLPGLVVGGAIALLGVLPPVFMNLQADPAVVSEANQVYVFERLAHHLAPLSKPPEWLQGRLTHHALAVLLLFIMTRSQTVRKRGGRPLSLVLRFAWASLLISATGLLIEVTLWDHPAQAASLLRYYWFRLADIAVPLAAALALGTLLVWLFEQKHRLAPLALFAMVALATWGVGGHAWERLDGVVAASDDTMRDPESWVAMCHWVAENTEPDALLLVPQRSQSLKWHTGRAVVVTYKDVPQDAQSMIEWSRRLHDVFQVGQWPDGKPRWTRSLARLGASRLRQLADQYGASYAISQDRHLHGSRASLPILHQTGPYTLYDLR